MLPIFCYLALSLVVVSGQGQGQVQSKKSPSADVNSVARKIRSNQTKSGNALLRSWSTTTSRPGETKVQRLSRSTNLSPATTTTFTPHLIPLQDHQQLFGGAGEINTPDVDHDSKFGDDNNEGMPGYPHPGHRTASAIGRHNLVEQLDKPIYRHPNMDDMPVQVMITMIPLKIQDLVEKMEVLETTIRLQLTWRDKRLSWDPKRFENVTEIVLPATTIWAPDIAVLNSVSDVYDVVRDMRFEMKVESTGRVWWHPTGIVKTYCKLSLRFFPFDRQTCTFVFESPTLDIRFMNLTLRSIANAVDTRMYLAGETWTLLQWGGRNLINKVGAKTFFARVEFFIHIERAKIYHVLNVMFFLVPVTHPQRLGSSTTTLLSVVVFQTVAISHLPNTSTDVPLLTIYIFFVVMVSTMSVVTSIVVAKFAVYAEKKMALPVWLARIPHPAIFLSCFRHCCCCRQSDHPRTMMGLTEDDICPMSSPKLEFVFIDPQNQVAVANSFDYDNNGRRPSSCNICVKPSTGTASSQPLAMTASIKSGASLGEDAAYPHPSAARSVSNQSYYAHRGSVPLPACHRTIGMTNLDQCTRHYAPNNSNNNNGLLQRLASSAVKTPLQSQSSVAVALHVSSSPSLSAVAPGPRRLFANWNDVSLFVDICLMIAAASIALVSPVILFVIVPGLADQSYQHHLERLK